MKDTLSGIFIGVALVFEYDDFFSNTIKEKSVKEFIKDPDRY